MTWRVRDLVGLTAVIGAVPTVAVALDPTVRFAAESPETRIALQTTHTLIASFAAYLVYGRFRRRRLQSDLLLVYALALLAAMNLFFAVLPSSDAASNTLVFQTWAPLLLRLLATAAIAGAAVMGERQITVQRPGATVFLAVSSTLAAVAFGVAALVNVLPQGVEVVEETVGSPELDGHPVLIVGHLLMAGLSVLASRGFLRGTRGRDPLIAALAVGSLLSAFSFVCFAVYPSADTDIVQSGDALRLGFYLVLLFGAEREIARYWGQLASVAVYEERRRLARDLHDGVAQELAYVVSQTRMLVRGQAPEGTDERIAAAAERALDESRRAITALTTTQDEPLHLAIARAAEDTAGRVGVHVDVDASPQVAVAPATREALVRIVQESITNAARHGKARNVRVGFSSEGVLEIVDDGVGFTPDTATPDRFGLVSMRERAERLNARFRIESQPGTGTRVEVALR